MKDKKVKRKEPRMENVSGLRFLVEEIELETRNKKLEIK